MSGMNIYDILCMAGDDFIIAAYNYILNRDPDPEGLSYYRYRLSQGYTKESIVSQLSKSKEANDFNAAGLRAFFKSYRSNNNIWSRFFSTKIKQVSSLHAIHQSVEILTKRLEDITTTSTTIPLSQSIDLAQLKETFNQFQSTIHAHEKSLNSQTWSTDLRFSLLSAAIHGTLVRGHNQSQIASIDSLRPLKDPSFSIIINTYNRAHTLPNTLDSLRKLRYKNFEVIVVNGPSTDDTAIILELYKGKCIIADCPIPNLSMSRNIGIAKASGDIVCFIDDDAIPESNWLDELAIAYSAAPIGGAGGYIRDNTGYAFQCKTVVCDSLGDSIGFENPEDAAIYLSNNPDTYFSFTGTNCSFRRDALKLIGGFDEEFAYFLDETDVAFRLHNAGLVLQYAPAAEIHHKFASSHLRTPDKIPKSIYLSARSKAYFCFKNGARYHDAKSIFDYLIKYRTDLRRDYDWYLENAKITKDKHTQLHREIDQGLHDGISDAFLRAVKTDGVPHFQGAQHGIFTSYPVDPPDRLRICLLSQEYPPGAVGGIGRWIHELACGLSAKGHEVTVITTSINDFPTVDLQDGVWVHRVPISHHPNRHTPDLGDFPSTSKDLCYSFFDEVIRAHAVRNFDLASFPVWDVIGLALLVSRRLPTCVSLHTTYQLALPSKPEWFNDSKYMSEHVSKMIKAERFVLQHADAILGNSKAIIADIQNQYGIELPQSKYEIIYHGITPLSFFRVEPKSDSKINVLFVGRAERRKGIDLLLECIPSLCSRHENVHFHLAGDIDVRFDGERSIAQEFLRYHSESPWLPRVHVHGLVSDEALEKLYAEANIFVAPSRYESFGLIFLEAMRYGVPSIGTAIGGINEIIEHDFNGLLIPVDDVESLKNALNRLINSPGLRNSLGRSARETIASKFSSSAMLDSLENFFSKLRRATSPNKQHQLPQLSKGSLKSKYVQ